MAKLKLKDLDYIELDGTPKELADFIKNLKSQPHSHQSTDLNNGVETKVSFVQNSDFNKIRTETQFKPTLTEVILPSVEEIVDYIISKEDFEHHTKELQEKYFGRPVKYRNEPALYGSLDRIVRNARKIIVKEHNGTWDSTERRNLGGKTNVTVYKFIKKEETPIIEENKPVSFI